MFDLWSNFYTNYFLTNLFCGQLLVNQLPEVTWYKMLQSELSDLTWYCCHCSAWVSRIRSLRSDQGASLGVSDALSLVRDRPVNTQIAPFMGPTWGPPGSCPPQVGPMIAPWTLLSGYFPMSWHTRVFMGSPNTSWVAFQKCYGEQSNNNIWSRPCTEHMRGDLKHCKLFAKVCHHNPDFVLFCLVKQDQILVIYTRC